MKREKNYPFYKKLAVLLIVFGFIQLSNFAFSADSPENNVSIKPAEIHPLEKKTIAVFLSFCSAKGIRAKLLPVIQEGRRILFAVFENDPDTENLVAGIKILSSRYLLPLMREMLKQRNNEPGYVVLLVNLRGTKKMLTATILPSEAILFTAGRITQERFLSRVKINMTNF